MGNIKIIKGVFDTKLELEHAGIAAGFPSPASMRDAGLLDGDRVIIDRAVEPHDGSIVVAWWDGGFTMKFLDLTHRKDGYIELRPANPDYPVFKVTDPENFQIWGTVIHLIRTFEKI